MREASIPPGIGASRRSGPPACRSALATYDGRMIAILLWTTLALGPTPPAAMSPPAISPAATAQDAETPEEREAREKREREALVQRAVGELREAAKAAEARARVAVLDRWKELEDPRVIEEFGVALRSDEPEVRTVAIDALRWMKHDAALAELQALVKRDRKLRKDPELHASVLKAIGQHGSESSIELLTGQVAPGAGKNVLRPRVPGLGNIP